MRNQDISIGRERHQRLLVYAIITFGISAIAYLFLGFDRVQMLGYAVTCFAMLVFLNRGVLFDRPALPSREQRPLPTQD